MFQEIFAFDLRSNFRKPSTYIFFGVFFLLTFLLGLLYAGVFDVAMNDTNIHFNSASAVASIVSGLNDGILGLVNSVILVAVMATGIQKDYEYNTHPLYFSYPISKPGYFFGRYLSAFLTAAFVFSAQIIGYYFGTLFGIGTPLMGPFLFWNFAEPYLLFVLPNILLLGIIFFSVTTFTRSTLTAYLLCIVLLVIRSITSSMGSDLDNKELAALWEPFGNDALGYLTQYWTPSEQNQRTIPLEGVLLHNRLLWLGIAIVITAASFMRFSFAQFLKPFRLFKKRQESNGAPEKPAAHQTLATLPKTRQAFDLAARLRLFLYLGALECKKIVKSTFFLVICLLGIVMMFIVAQYMGAMYDTETYPLTYQIVSSVASIFQFFILILVVFLAGNIVWREREQKMDELIGTTPVSNTALFFSKYLGLLYTIAILLVVIIVTGICIQFSKSFYNVEPMLYIKSALRSWVTFGIIAGFCLAVQTLLPNKYLGFFVSLIPILFIEILFSLLEWNNSLYHFNSSGAGLPYSDMNGFGHVIYIWMLYKAYWLSIVLALCLFALFFFARGKEKGIRNRFRLAKQEVGGGQKAMLALFVLLAIVSGGYIYYNTRVLNEYISPKQKEEELVRYEKTYKRFENTPQLRIVESYVDVDLFPYQRKMDSKGYYYLKNKHEFPVDTLFVNYMGNTNKEYTFPKLLPALPARKVIDDARNGVLVYVMEKPLRPGDSMRFDFEVRYRPVGFKEGETETSIVYNGTFFNNSIFPSIGYNEQAELSSNRARKKYGLPDKPRMAAVDDKKALMNNYISNDADWIRFESTISTSDDQIAIAPGYLQKEWKEGDRHYYHYKMDSPILNFYAFLSARYEVKRDKWNDVNIEIYYHKGHEYNLDRMINSIKRSLDYYTAAFGPYQHKQVRILEFPRYASFAQSFPNTIPYSESIGFIAKVDDKDSMKIDVPFYVTAHEVAHQWWAHQVIGGNVQGCVVMSETMSQYSALMVMEKEYGKTAMKKFLQYEMDDYLKGRTMESKKEVPLMLCENQGYIHYNKGSVIMYSMRDYLGEQLLNQALSGYLNKVKFQEPPYTNSIEFVDALRQATPDSLRYIIKDMFETITIYENYVKDLSYVPDGKGNYQVKLVVGSLKFRADSLGKMAPIPVDDYIDIGIFTGEGTLATKLLDKPLVLQKIKMDQPEKTFEFTVNQKPTRAGIDPYNKLIDRNPSNNVWSFGSTPPKVDMSNETPKSVSISIDE